MPHVSLCLPGERQPPYEMTAPPTTRGPGAPLHRFSRVALLRGRRQDLEHACAANRTDALQGRPTVCHLDLLSVRDLAFCLAFHAVAFIRCHRSLSSLRHVIPP